MISHKKIPTEYLKSLAMLLIPLSIFALTLLMLVKPRTADWIAHEDQLIENLSALFLFASMFIFAFAALNLRRKYGTIRPVILLVALAVLSFLIGMEEISWMQRILEIKSTTFFLENNMQAETNFHNLSTFFFENIYYFGTFLFFVVLPFFKDKVVRFLKGHNYLDEYIPFVPGVWMFIAFAGMASLVKGSVFLQPLITLAALVAIAMLIHVAIQKKPVANGNPDKNTHAVFVLCVTVASAVVFTYTNYTDVVVRPIVGTEYREFYISLALLLYSASILYRTFKVPDRFSGRDKRLR